MDQELILKKLESIENMLSEQNILKKDVLNFREAARYLGFSHSHLYNLTSTAAIPVYRPNGKKLYFSRHEIDGWLLSNRQASSADAQELAGRVQPESGRI